MDLCLEPVDFKLLDLSVNYLVKKGLSIPENKVPFQKGQSLAEFLELYGADEQCEDALCKARWPEGFQCPA